MSSLIERPFDVTQKINRAIFKGSPNLLTTSDLNRQIEALKYQLDALEERVGAQSDLEFDVSWTDMALSVQVTALTYLVSKGASFSPSVAMPFISSEPVYNTEQYFCLVAEKEIITHASDPSHEIAGALFEDGTSQESANQEVYKDEYLFLTTDPTTLPEGHYLIAILAIINRHSPTRDVHIVKNYTPRYSSVKTNLQIDSIYVSEKNNLEVGMSYEEAFSVLYKNILVESLVPEWTYGEMTNGKYSHVIFWRIKNGLFEVKVHNDIRVDNGGNWEFTISGYADVVSYLTNGKTLYTAFGMNDGYGAIRNAYIGQFTLQNDFTADRVGWASIELNDSDLPILRVREMDVTGFITSNYADLKVRRPSVLSMCLT